MSNGPKFTEEQWTIVCNVLSHILAANSPSELLHPAEPSNNTSPTPHTDTATESPDATHGSTENAATATDSTADAHQHQQQTSSQENKTVKKKGGATRKIFKGKCAVQINLIETLNEIAFTHYINLSTPHLVTLLDSLQQCYSFAHTANNNPLILSKLAKTTGTL
jgi:hypothetical protein